MAPLLQVSPGNVWQWVLLAVVALLIVMVVWQIENWGRDFVTNVAETASNAKDDRLRPIETNRPIEEVADIVESTAGSLKGWQFVKRSHGNGGVTAIDLTRTTAWLRFTDDIAVYLEELPNGGTRLQARSASRMGVGDLGQNPRNLRELLGPLRVHLSDVVGSDLVEPEE